MENKALERGAGKGSRKSGIGGVAWIAETYATKYVSGGCVSKVLRVPLDQLEKVEQSLGKFKVEESLGNS